jgi:uncharacterized protein YceK
MRAVALAALAVLLSGCASGGDHRAGAADLAPGGFKEFKVAMDKGDALSWTWTTEPRADLHFDFHTHTGGGAQTLDEKRSPAGEGTFKAPEDGSYYLFWQNDGNATVQLAYEFDTEGKVKAEYQ